MQHCGNSSLQILDGVSLPLRLAEELRPLTGGKCSRLVVVVCTTSSLPSGAGVKGAPQAVGDDSLVPVTHFDCESEWPRRGTLYRKAENF